MLRRSVVCHGELLAEPNNLLTAPFREFCDMHLLTRLTKSLAADSGCGSKQGLRVAIWTLDIDSFYRSTIPPLTAGARKLHSPPKGEKYSLAGDDPGRLFLDILLSYILSTAQREIRP